MEEKVLSKPCAPRYSSKWVPASEHSNQKAYNFQIFVDSLCKMHMNNSTLTKHG